MTSGRCFSTRESRVRMTESIHAGEVVALSGLVREPGETGDVLARKVLRERGIFFRELRREERVRPDRPVLGVEAVGA